jgi:hypothetical protein
MTVRGRPVLRAGTCNEPYYTIYNEKYFSDDQFSYIVRVLTWRAWRRIQLPVAIAKMSWIRVLDMPSCYGRANVAIAHFLGSSSSCCCTLACSRV